MPKGKAPTDMAMVTDAGMSGFFSYDNSKSLTIMSGHPREGWVTMSFTDESDPLGLDGQMFYVPQVMFNRVVQNYMKAEGLVDSSSTTPNPVPKAG